MIPLPVLMHHWSFQWSILSDRMRIRNFRKAAWTVGCTISFPHAVETTKYDILSIQSLDGLGLPRAPTIKSQNDFLTAVIWSSDGILSSCSSEKYSQIIIFAVFDRTLRFHSIAYSITALYGLSSKLLPATAVARSLIHPFSSCIYSILKLVVHLNMVSRLVAWLT